LIGRLVRSVDFERVMATPGHARSKHFILQYLDGSPSFLSEALFQMQSEIELSTDPTLKPLSSVDDSKFGGCFLGQKMLWLGLVVPKRHAKRAVTRSLLKRQMRTAVVRQQQQALPLKNGLWVLRLRAVFEVSMFKSAASTALIQAASNELQELLVLAAKRCVLAR
jgi:ribonuclease P protein component